MSRDPRTFFQRLFRRKTLFLLVVLCLTAGAYWQVRNHGFINYDDPWYVVGNPHVDSGLSAANVRWAFSSFEESNWHPLTWLSHMADVGLFGMNPGRHHLVNLLIHLANALLLFLFLDRATGAWGRSAFVAALFALHPLHVESVAWIAERKDVLSTLFFMLALLLYLRYARRPTRGRYLAVLGVFAFGLMSKPMVVTLPVVLLLLDYWPLGRMAPGGGTLPGLVREKVPLFALSAASAIVTVIAQQRGGAMARLEGVPFAFRCASALRAYAAYIGKAVWPVDLSIIYPLPLTVSALHAAAAALALAGVTAICVRSAERRPYLIVGWLWFLATLVPVIGLVQVGAQFIADRYTYVPLVGLFAMVAWGAPALVPDGPGQRAGLSVAAGVILLACSVLTWRQAGYWKDTITLFGHATDAVKGNYVAHNILGDTLAGMGRDGDAIRHYAEALRVRPGNGQALVGMGKALARQGRMEEALRYLDEELRINSRSADGHAAKGAVLLELGRPDQAVEHLRRALEADPGCADALISLGTARIRQGRFDEGLRCFARALAGNPDDAELHVRVGLALAMEGRLDEGIAHFRDAIRAKPEFADAHYNLGAALARQGRFDEAIVEFREAERLAPALEQARRGLEAAIARERANGRGKD